MVGGGGGRGRRYHRPDGTPLAGSLAPGGSGRSIGPLIGAASDPAQDATRSCGTDHSATAAAADPGPDRDRASDGDLDRPGRAKPRRLGAAPAAWAAPAPQPPRAAPRRPARPPPTREHARA